MIDSAKGEGRIIGILFLAALSLLVFSGLFTYRMGFLVIQNNQEMTRRLFVLSHLANFLSALKDTETGQRDFLLTGKEPYLQSYQHGLTQVQTELAGLQRIAATGDLRGADVEKVNGLTQEKLAEWEHTIRLRRRGLRTVLPLVRSVHSEQIMDEIRAATARMQVAEQNRFAAASLRARRETTVRTASFIGFGLVDLLFLGWAFVKLSREVHRRESALAQVHRQRDLLHTTLSSIGDAVIVTDADGCITFLNREAERLTGWTAAEANGEFLQSVFKIINETTRQPVENPVEKVLRLGAVVGLGNHTVLLSKDGRETPIDDSAAPIRHEGGPSFGVVLVFRDFTEQRENAEIAARLSAIVQYSGDAIISKNLDGIIRTWNAGAERLLGYRSEEMIGKSIRTIIPPDRQPEEDEILRRIRNGKAMERLETMRRAKDGRLLHVSITVSPLKDREGRVIGASKIMHDISEIMTAHEALAQEKELLAVTLASIGDAVLVTDAEGRVTSLNREAERLTGWNAPDAQGRMLPEVFKIVNEATRQPVENPVDKVLQFGMVVGLANHTLLISKDGRETAIDDSAAPIRQPGGPLFGVVLIFRDFSEQREAQQRLESELLATRLLQRLGAELIYESNVEAIYDQIVEVGMKIMRADFASFQFFHPECGNGGELQLLAFRGFTSEAAKRWEWVGANSKGTVCGKVMRTVQRIIIQDVEDCSFMRGTADLDIFRQTGIRSCQATPLLSRHGRLLGVISTHWKTPHEPSERDLRFFDLLVRQAADLLERKKSDEALRESEERFKQLAENIPQLAWMAGPDGGIFWYNQRWYDYTGTNFEQMQGWGWEAVHDPDHLEHVKNLWRVALEKGESWQDTFPLRGKNGKCRWFLSRAFPIRDADGHIIRWFGSNTDITELREAQHALSRSKEELEILVAERTAKLQEMVEELQHVSYSITHDMRAPLRAMNIFSEKVLEEETGITARGRDYLKRIITAGRRFDRLIQDALNYTKAVQMEMPLESVDLSHLVRGLIETYPNFHPDKADIRIEGKLPVVIGNESLLTQCFSNLLGNAVKFVAPGVKPKVRVTTEIHDGTTKIWIKDNGIGIPEHAQRRLFKMFQKLDNQYEGTGIGLAVVRKVVERMSGKVGVESQVGRGSNFWVELRAVSTNDQTGG